MRLDYFHTQMPKPTAKTTLYRLIEAGYLARHALLVPLTPLGLEPGDDAVLLCLKRKKVTGIAELAEQTGLPETALEMRLTRLEVGGKVQRQVADANLAAGICLTDEGAQTKKALRDHWQRLEEALIGELEAKDAKKLRKVLKRFIQLLQL